MSSSSSLNLEGGASDPPNYQSISGSEHAAEEVDFDEEDDLGGNNISSMEIGSPRNPPSGQYPPFRPNGGYTAQQRL